MPLSIMTFGYIHDQTSASTNWLITHKLNTLTPVVDCFVDIGPERVKIIPMSVQATSSIHVVVTFSQAYTGQATVV